MPGRRVARPPHRGVGKALATLAALLVIGGIGWVAYDRLSDGGSSGDDAGGSTVATQRTGSAPSQQPDEGPASQPSDSQKLVRACRHEIAKAHHAVSVARPGVRDWNDHVRARTAMLKGRISEKKMNAIWDRTRSRGPADVRRFEAALRPYHGRPRCRDLQSARHVPRSQRALVTRCETRSRAVTKAVADAAATIGDWKAHLKHMDTYADGGMTSGTAQRLWVKAWRSAPKNISAFRAAGDRLRKAPPCVIH
jgi:hypothetical protein